MSTDPSGTSSPTTVPAALRLAAQRYPDRGIAVFDRRGRHHERRTHPQLLSAVETQAARLATLGIRPGEPVLVALPTSWEWLETWFGLVFLGALPVALAGGGVLGAARAQIEKIETVMGSLGARHVIAGEALKREAARAERAIVERAVTPPGRLAEIRPASDFEPLPAAPNDLAFLQLTSGSTGSPRAVMISHRGALHNNLASDEGIGGLVGGWAHEWADCMVSWLPLYHDMGLVGSLMLPMFSGLDLWLLSPDTFLSRPQIWLRNLAQHGTAFAAAPNFAYQLCVERVDLAHLEGVDLSHWRGAQSGAEMIRPETTTAFAEKFGPVGFSALAFQPCYGLAEATLAVTFDGRREGVRSLTRPGLANAAGEQDFVCLGEPIRDTELKIVAPDGRGLGEDTVGEVWIQGPGVFKGYYQDPEATAEALRDGWLATGDLGFLHDGELYLTGRLKDILIVRGHNLMPEELERLADAVSGGGGRARSGAFSVPHGGEGEQAVLVLEAEDRDPKSLAAMAHEVKVRIGNELSLPLADVAFVRRGRLPRTSSGKIQRRALRRQYLDGSLDRLPVEEE